MSSIVYAYEEMHSVGIGPGSPVEWSAYSSINPFFREMLETLYTPAAYKALHYNPNTFKRIYELPGMMRFSALEIFKLENGKFTPQLSHCSRAPYRPIFVAAQQMVKANHRNILQNLIERNTDDVSPFVNMGFACETRVEGGGGVRRKVLFKGFFPYFSNSSAALGEIMFFFTRAETDRLALVTAPAGERQQAIEFIRAHGVIQFFDKVCAQCGLAASDLYKCPCKTVRYCCTECHHAHWPMHKPVCGWKRG